MKIVFKKFLLIFIISFLTISLSYSYNRGKQQLLQPGHFIYDALTALAIESGTVNFADQAPISIAEATYYLSNIDIDNLSPAAQNYYNQILDYLNQEQIEIAYDLISVGLRPEINLEGYYKTNNEANWVYDYLDRKPLIALPVFLSVGDFITMESIVEGQQNKGARLHNDNYSNIPINVDQFDINFPSYGYFSTGYSFTPQTHMNIALGLGPQSIGRSINGSVIMNENLTGTSYFNFKFYNSHFKYNMNVTQFNVNQYLYTHGMDLQLFNKFQFSFSESMFVYAPLELRFLNPLTVFHGQTPWLDYTGDKYKESNTCAYMCFKAAYTPFKYLKLYGIFAQDQYQTKHERDYSPNDTTPNAIGMQFGAESFIPAGEGYFHSWIEGCYTDPFLYIKEGPNWSLVRTYRENFGDLQVFYEWVGSPFGPDTISGQLNFGYEVPSKYALTLSYLFLAKGEYSGTNIFTKELDWGGHDTKENITEWPYPGKDSGATFEERKRRQALIAPSGIPEYVNRVSIFGSYNLNNWVTFFSQVSVTSFINKNNILKNNLIGGEFVLSANVKLMDYF